MRSVPAFLALLCAAVCSAQPPRTTSVFTNPEVTAAAPGIRLYYPTGLKEPAEFMELTSAIRTIADMQAVYPMPAIAAIAARGERTQLDATEWLVRNLEPGKSGRATAKFDLPDRPDSPAPELSVLHSPLFETAAARQDVINAMRAVADMQRVYGYGPSKSVAIRGTAAQAAFAEWIADTLAKAQSAPPPTEAKPAAYTFPDARGATDARIFFLPSALRAGVQDLINALRTTTDVQRIFPIREPNAILMRGTPAQAAMAEWFIGEVNKPAARPAN